MRTAARRAAINRFRLSNESLFSVCALNASWVDKNHATERFILKPQGEFAMSAMSIIIICSICLLASIGTGVYGTVRYNR